MKTSDPSQTLCLRFLTLEQVQRIDDLLRTVGDYGELRLIVQKGELRYLNKVESHKVLSSPKPDSRGNED